MAGKKQRVEAVVPAAARTIASLRDIGYQLPQAVADIVDNSVSAGATTVSVDLHFDGADSWIRIADDGTGMDATTLTESLRYGSMRGYDDDDLGKFGFGLKTASTSQCRRVVVASRRSPERARVEVRALDLSHIEDTDRWEIIVLDPADRPSHLVEPLRASPGTVVLWEDLDRVLNYKDPWGVWAKRKMVEHAESIANHLGMVFHRFLSRSASSRALKITVNGSTVQPWDPFCVDEKGTTELDRWEFPVTTGNGGGIVRISPFVLPSQSDFSSTAAWQRASGPLKWNRQQGFYIYRANRLIQSGGWNGIRTLDEHSKLARVAIDFTPDLDAVFGINISKAIVKLPLDLREALEPIVSQAAGLANRRYRKVDKGTRNSNPRRGSAPSAGGGSAQSGPSQSGSPPSSRTNPSGGNAAGKSGTLQATPGGALDEAARDTGEERALARIKKRLSEIAPDVKSQLGW